MEKWNILLLIALFLSVNLPAQPDYPAGYFIYPVKAQAGLSANFGELRPNHYHMGLDCKTDKRENLPVVAAAAGYVSAVKIEPFGFGRAIYINHPNGYTTLYSHLNDFFPELEQYVKAEQYRQKSWKVFLNLPPGKFNVSRGQFIAYSGNTGGSQGPHLHFEIRDTKTEKVLNPLLFGFPIPDKTPPDILKLAVYDRNKSTYEQSPLIFNLKKSGAVFVPVRDTLLVQTNRISFGITAFDRFTGAANQNGIYKAMLYENKKPLLSFRMDNISYDETRYLNAHIDYKNRISGGSYIQHLSILPGNITGIYEGSPTNGVIDLSDGLTHVFRIEVFDAAGNKSELRIPVKSNNKPAARVHSGNDLFTPGQINVFENEDLNFYLPENALYDSFHFSYSKQKTGDRVIYRIHNAGVPVHDYFTVSIHPEEPFSDTGKVMMKWSHAGKTGFEKATLSNGFYRAPFRAFGDFELFQDSLPPLITPVGFNSGMTLPPGGRITFRITDNSENIAACNGYLDGRWILFSNDKGKVFIHKTETDLAKGKHELKIVAVDPAGNKSEKKYFFNY